MASMRIEVSVGAELFKSVGCSGEDGGRWR